jgi:hypothetical protein
VLFLTLGTNSVRKFRIQEIPGHFVQFREIREIRPGKNVFYRIRSAQQVPSRISEIGTFSDIFSGNVTNLKKVQKNAKNAKNAKKCPENTRNFGCFIENRAVAICRSIEKSVENDTEIPMHTPCTLFKKFPRGIFGVFINLESGKISEKRRFRRFLEKIFTFCVLPAGGRRYFYMGRKSELRFFRKVRNTFSVLGPILCCFTRENPSGRKWRRLQITYRPLVAQGVSFPYAFLFRFGCEMASKKKWTVLQYYYRIWKWGGRCNGLPFSKTRFPRF